MAVAGAAIEIAFYAGIVAGIGFGLYQAVAPGASRLARWVLVALVVGAVLFCVVVVAWDDIAGTGTSTESLIILIAAFPLLIAAAVVACIDRALRRLRRPMT